MKRICAECRHFGSQVVSGLDAPACCLSPPVLASNPQNFAFKYPMVAYDDTCASWSPVDRAKAVCGNCQWFRERWALRWGDRLMASCLRSELRAPTNPDDTCASWSLRDEPEKPDTAD